MSDEAGRREFIRQALVALPLSACALEAGSAHDEVERQGEELSLGSTRVQRRRERWRRLVDLHMGRENLHDLPGVLQTFGKQAEMIFNGQPFTTPDQIAEGHVLFGMSAMAGALANTQVAPERHYYTDDELLVEGKLIADHVGTIGAFPATNRRVELHYSAFYRFDDEGELVSERIVMNWAPLAMPA